MRIILSVGGGGKGSENFAAVACSLSKVETFVRTARGLVDEYGLDGIDGELIFSAPSAITCLWLRPRIEFLTHGF
jgi:hypothetical protein